MKTPSAQAALQALDARGWQMPELPEPFDHIMVLNGAAIPPADPIEEIPVYDADQMREYGRRCVSADVAWLKRKLCEAHAEGLASGLEIGLAARSAEQKGKTTGGHPGPTSGESPGPSTKG